MASFNIQKRLKADDVPKYQMFIGVKERGAIVYNESRTFTKEKAAKTWGKKRVVEIEERASRSN